MKNQVSKLSVFTSPAGELEVLRAYDRVLQHWSVPYTEQVVPTSFGQTHVIVSGPPEAPPIVFLHPLLATSTIWGPNVEELSRDFRTYAVDIVGEPNRSVPSRPMTKSSDITQWFSEVLDGLGLAEAHLVGASFGGFLSAGLAMEMPERIRRLVLIDPAATFHAIVPFYIHLFIPKFLSLLFPRLPSTRQHIRRGMNWLRNGLPPDPLWEDLFFATMVHGGMTNHIFPRVYPRRRLATISMPTLLLIGAKERLYRPSTVFRRASKWVPDIQTQIIPNAYHFAALSQPGIVNSHLQEFLADAGSAGPLGPHSPVQGKKQPQRSAESQKAHHWAKTIRQATETAKAVPLFITAPLFRHWHLRWGATDQEVTGPMPGDELVPVSHFTATRAITIDADPEMVWPWLMQVGFKRAGFYAYDLLDSLGEPSAETILPQWQDPHIGDVAAPMTSEATPSTSFTVASLHRPDSIVWSKPDSTWAWHLTKLPTGGTRLVTRLKQRYRPGPSLILTVPLLEFGDFPMMRKMLLGIKARAEATASASASASTQGRAP